MTPLILWTGMIMCVFSCISFSQHATIINAFPNLTFTRAVDLQHAGDSTHRLFVVSQVGVIYVFQNDVNASEAAVFLDIRHRVELGFELGLLGLAFHPNFTENGFLYVNYNPNTGQRRNVISRFTVSKDNPNRVDEDSEVILMEIPQPLPNHNGGQLAFGPDGYLYVAVGDGGGAGDPGNNAQNLTNLLGTILRIDVDNPDDGLNYGIPHDNPFVNNTLGYREEIFAYGLRNPWRMSFDFQTGWLWCGDVGQQGWEVIHIIESGKNYGWNIIEGSHCFSPPTGCDTTGLEMPLYEYAWLGFGSAITGGYVYRGSRFPELYGKYIYGDYGFGLVWALEYNGVSVVNSEIINTDLNISTFGVDEFGELYIVQYSGGQGAIYTFDSVTNVGDADVFPKEYRLHQNYPNPFNNRTTIQFSVPRSQRVAIKIYNLLGQAIETLVDGFLEGGDHIVTWDAAGSVSGLYFYRMYADDYVHTRKMILLQ